MDERQVKKKKGNGGEATFAVVDKRPAYGDDAAIPEPRYPTLVEELQARAEEAERRTREISAAYKRMEDEREAFRERLGRDLERRVDIARSEILRKVLAVLDDLDRALAAARQSGSREPLVEGVALTRDHLLQALASEGVEAIETKGQPFDPATSEAVAIEPVDDPGLDNRVIEQLARGYSLGGALLRPAKVRVGRAAGRPPGASEDAGASDSEPLE